jgi:hypothetical protein
VKTDNLEGLQTRQAPERLPHTVQVPLDQHGARPKADGDGADLASVPETDLVEECAE